MTHFLEHVIHQGTTTVGTSDLAAELPILQEIHDTEQELIAARNRERNRLRERDVFIDEMAWPGTAETEALRERLYELEDQDNRYRDFWTSYKWYMGYGGYAVLLTQTSCRFPSRFSTSPWPGDTPDSRASA